MAESVALEIALGSGVELMLFMLKPNEGLDQLRLIVMELAIADAIGKVGNRAPLVHPQLALDLARIPRPVELNKELALAKQHGAAAGVILNFVLGTDAHADTKKYATQKNAFRLVAHCYGGQWGWRTENIKRNIWPKFRPVAHLWAALHLWASDLGKNPDLTMVSDDEELRSFLGIAGVIQSRARSCKRLLSANADICRIQVSIEGKGAAPTPFHLSYGRVSDEVLKVARGLAGKKF
jgi:hypothetical protein